MTLELFLNSLSVSNLLEKTTHSFYNSMADDSDGSDDDDSYTNGESYPTEEDDEGDNDW